ncbi:MAG: transcriptional repressor [Candidatus Brocadiae bacterium]|nr:transcriptional repressor [Candidatus Brocadiia bacterium]
MTRQRKVILEELRKSRSHPTADELYARVRRRLPRISLGMVYRNLDMLTERGIIEKLEVGGSQKRFDADTEHHHHVRCLGCGRVQDVPVGGGAAIGAALPEVEGYEITGYRLEFLGHCPRCRKRLKSTIRPGVR